MTDTMQRFSVIRVSEDGSTTAADQVAREAALEVRLHGEPFAVIMRTPGADRDLATGFLFTEGVITTAADVQAVAAPAPDVIDVTLSEGLAASVPALVGTRRQVTLNSSCGMCGRRSLESLEMQAAPLPVEWHVAPAVVAGLPETLRDAQQVFAETGGLHAAALFARDGRVEASAEDVGRHNAVDKLIGRMLAAGRLPLSGRLLFVSGRSSFEIVQKAWQAGVPLVAAVSAPSSLAVSLARQAGITLIGFVRDGRFNIYAHEARVGGRPAPAASPVDRAALPSGS
jgi:FdhD protein